MKKTLSVFLAVVMALTVLSVVAFAAGTPVCDFGAMEFKTNGTPVVIIFENDNVVVTWDESARQVIPASMKIIGSDIKMTGAAINQGVDDVVDEAGVPVDGWYLNGVKVTENFADDTVYTATWVINNKIDGVYEEYPETRTVTFTAVGVGMDNEEPAEGDVRYCPVYWTTDEDNICGNFVNADGEFSPEARYTNRLFGDHTLTVSFEKQTFNGEEWVAPDGAAADVKSVSYYVGPNEYEEKEIIFPKQILTYIYVLLTYLIEKVVSFIK